MSGNAGIAAPETFFDCSWGLGDWLLVQQMLGDMDRLFNAAGIDYFLAFGTYLGAVRHGGVIPWDDDVDVGILGSDESKLLQLKQELARLGYSLIPWTIPRETNSKTIYKLWISSLRPTIAVPWSWPFIDIFVFHEIGSSERYSDGSLTLAVSDLLPTRRLPFGPLDLPVPATEHMLHILYGENCMQECVSNGHDHRLERGREQATMDWEELVACGRCIDVAERERFGPGGYPCQSSHVTESGDDGTVLCAGTDLFKLNSQSKTIWSWCDGETSVASMIERISDHYDLPVIDVTIDVVSALKSFHNNKLIAIRNV